jgi:N-acyl-L-homoserine lactone synthetase
MQADDFTVDMFRQQTRPDLVRSCQRLRYEVYHRDLGLDTPDMDHRARLDVEDNDPVSDFLSVTRRSDGTVVGCLRLQTAGAAPFYAEKEFVLQGPWWHGRALVEGARFAVATDYRDSEVPLRLFAGFRRYCRAREVGHLLSVSIVPDAAARPERALSILRWLGARMRTELSRGRPAAGYGFDGLSMAAAAAVAPAEADTLPAMVRMLANDRTTLCSLPAYCRRFHTWNFLLSTDLRPAAVRREEVA